MIQLTKKMFNRISLILIIILNLSCKENIKQENKVPNQVKIVEPVKQNFDSTQIISSIEENNQSMGSNQWVFSKAATISNPQACNENKYEDFKFSISNDSVFIDNKYTDNVISGELKSEVLYKKYGISKEFLFNNFNINLPQKVKYIRNAKAYDSSSVLERFFRDAFYIDNFIIFESEGCVYCFKNIEVKEIKNNIKKINLPITSNTILNIKTNILNKTLFNDYSCGDLPRGYYLGKRDNYDIYIVSNDCGDFPFKDLIIVKSNIIVSKINIEGDSWDIEKEEKKKIREENVISFSIDKNFNLTIQNTKNINNKEKNKTISNYFISNGKFVKK